MGRRKMMFIIHTSWFISLCLSTSGYESLFFLGRFLGGVSGGFNTGTFAIYNKEMSPP